VHEKVESKIPVTDWLNPSKTIRAVLCYVSRGREYLLIRKSKGRFGEGLWNAPGGKMESGETSEEAARREVLEETGLVVNNLTRAGFLEFRFGQKKKVPDWTAEVFSAATFSGILKQSEEGELRWFLKDEMPLEQMWQDDKYWLPLLFSGVKFKGIFEFTLDLKEIVRYEIIRL
jgi:8-oxo-dGTP pyrophosphatase MutT (NUDIX family)